MRGTPSHGRRHGRGRGLATALATALALAGALGLAGCVGTPTAPTPVPSTVAPTPGETEPPAPAIDIGGTAAQNQAFFDVINTQTIASGVTDGRSFIDALVAAGYAKEAMEVTPDRTTVNAQADNIQFAVRLNGTCLVGQYGSAGYASFAGPLLADGHCLIGTTRPIDW